MHHEFHPEYGYNRTETFMMTLICIVSNGFLLNNFMLAWKRNKPHILFTTGLTLVTSFMYHLSDSLGRDDLFLEELEWHRLDNIGAIASFIEVFNYMMQNKPETTMHISWIGFIVVFILQEGYAWELWATVLPIAVVIVMFLFKQILSPPKRKVDRQFLKYGLVVLAMALVAFSKGLDEFKDYLRAWHGLWHVLISISLFYLIQIYESDPYTLKDVWLK